MKISIQYADGFETKVYNGFKAKAILRRTLKGTEFAPEDIRALRHGQALVRPGQVAEALHYRGRMWVSVYDDNPSGRWDLFTLYLG